MSSDFYFFQDEIADNIETKFQVPTKNMVDDFEFSEILGYTKNFNDIHDILITILKNDNVEQFFSLCKCIKQHPFTLTLKKVSIFDIALMHQAINIADFILISSIAVQDEYWIQQISLLLWTYKPEIIHKFLLRFIDYPEPNIFRTQMIIEKSMLSSYLYALSINENDAINTLDYFDRFLSVINKKLELITDSAGKNPKIYIINK